MKKQNKNDSTSNYVLDENLIKTDLKQGLSEDEVKIRCEKYGKNVLEEAKKKNGFLIYLGQFKDLLVIILLFATLLSYILAIVHGIQTKFANKTETIVSFVEPSIILFVVLTNSLVGAIQEIKSQKAIDALKKLNPLQAKVIRHNELISINSEDIVPGDIVMLEAGDIVPADGFLLQSSNFLVIESSLTGESLPVEKDANAPRDMSINIADRKFMVFSSSIVSKGTAYFVVTHTGKNTELGKISELVNSQKQTLSPLQLKINKLGKVFAFAGIGLFLVSVIVQIIFQAIDKLPFSSTVFWSTTIISGISLAVAAIPEGLVAFTSIILAIGVQRMAKRKAIIKDNLSAVEALGSCAVICSDKTGTLTQNKMTVVNLFSRSQELGLSAFNEKTFLPLVKFAALCNESNIVEKDGETKEVGDPTEVALIYSLKKYTNIKTKKELMELYPRLETLPFDSDRKLMTTINKIDGENVVIVKGAPDIIINHCLSLDKTKREEVLNTNQKWANEACRVLAVAIKKISNTQLDKVLKLSKDEQIKELESNLEFVGLIAMIDPPRESSKEAIQTCISAGIKPVMITGDNINTAIAIAKNIGIYHEGDIAMTGAELTKLSDKELENIIEKISVYARVVPEDKLRIVKAWQSKYQVVAMTGDGVNDAPALKAAEIGCAMGITGTEASKQAADMVLADDNFATVVKAVENGRSVFQKIKNVIQNLLITSVAEIIAVFFGLIIFKFVFKNEILSLNEGEQFMVLSATQLLWINLFTHGFPAIALGIQDSKENYMDKRPISKYESIFARGMGINTLWQGILIGILSLVAYYLGAFITIQKGNIANGDWIRAGSTAMFLVLGISAAFNAINLMSKKPIILSNPLYYWKVYASVIFSIVFLLIVAFISPIARVFRGVENLSQNGKLVAISLCMPLVLIPIYFAYKMALLIYAKRHEKESKITTFELIQPPKSFLKKMAKRAGVK
ncbi:Ca2+-transporting ATPase [Metamycoplasma subdolum]|uniref:Ca2+-transporting ATPase n=1 Tax=Metamycoplasma subdolum TaxID=92407 RepID=A0A3M0A6F9_9BACT|nr:cation-translocating P-type ATPase [Metamycoplasma subdolum]RMA79099.1 Ca2+-transporting ATPase [Metamycoplasma subdolum]WPB50622.1 cation-translocating P-type ATPase [Metamycoplasma subdolum]